MRKMAAAAMTDGGKCSMPYSRSESSCEIPAPQRPQESLWSQRFGIHHLRRALGPQSCKILENLRSKLSS